MANGGVSAGFIEELNAVHSLPASSKAQGYSKLLDTIFASSSEADLAQNLSAYVLSLLGSETGINGVSESKEPLSIIAARELLTNYINRLKTIPSANLQITVAQQTLEHLTPRVLSFEEQDSALKLLLAEAHQTNEDYLATARTLQSIALDTSQRNVTDTYRAEIWVRIARCYLEEGDATSASTYINRAKNIMHNVPDKTMRLQFQMCQARILDSQRAFLDASTAYHNMSFEALVDDDDRLQALSAAIVCAVLAPAGPQRARTLARLYKDERAAQTEEYAILEKIFLDRVLAPAEVTAFAAKLQPHQLAKTADGSTVLDRAVLEHNLLGASKLYRNISVHSLGTMLGVPGDRAEQYAAQMIEQKRLVGHIDQIDGTIFFDSDGGADAGSMGGARGSAAGGGTGDSAAQKSQSAGVEELRRWDASIQGIAEDVEKIVTMIQAQYPDFYTANMA